jgi:predicted nuclease of predicted toxin-antitoxin system
MLKFVIDEDIPRSTGIILKENGYDILDIRDHGLRGEKDEKIYEFAQENGAVVLTGDRGFGNTQRFPLGEHNGIVVTNFPNEMPTSMINQQLLVRLKHINEDDYKGNVIIIDPLKIRIRRPES